MSDLTTRYVSVREERTAETQSTRRGEWFQRLFQPILSPLRLYGFT
jgi:hypothetical protein